MRGFLRPNLEADNLQQQFFRAIDLAELLFNLQYIDGFYGCLGRLRGGDLEPTIAELDVARMLYINDHMFWFVDAEGETGKDYDLRVVLPGLRIANIEAKCNLETPEMNLRTIKNSLDKARKQLPPGQNGVIFVKIPAQWLNEPSIGQQTGQLALDFMRGTSRVVSVKYYAAPIFFENGRIGQGHRFMEITSPRRQGENWDMLTNWMPSSEAWNALPRKWIRMVFYADQNWGQTTSKQFEYDSGTSPLPTRLNRVYITGMPARKPRPPDEKPQIEKFREAARELGCDDDQEAFWAKVTHIARHKPKDEPEKPSEK